MALGPPASHDFTDLSALANAASARPTWWRIARAAQAGEPAATRPLRSAVGELTRRKRTAQHTPEAPEEERGRVRRGIGVAVVGVRVQKHCEGWGWWLRCAQEPLAESGHPVRLPLREWLPTGMRRAFWDGLAPVPAPFTLNGTHQDYTDCSTHRHD